MFRLKISKFVDNNYRVMQTHNVFKRKKTISKFLWVSNDKKLDNNISRAISSIFSITSFNKFTYFYTQTIDSIYARTDLKSLIKKFNLITRQLRQQYKDKQFYYLLIPEYHEDGQNWHLHGFLSKDYDILSYINRNGFKELAQFDKLGFNSLSKIRNYGACCKYVTKYVTKDLIKNFNKGDKFYYCSQRTCT